MKKHFLAAVILLLAISAIYLASRPASAPQELSETQFTAKFHSNLIAKCQLSYPAQPPHFVQDIRGIFYETDSSGQFLLENGSRKQSRFHSSFRVSDDLTRQLLASTNFSVVTLNPVAQKLKDVLSAKN
jgi:hypothetical protein